MERFEILDSTRTIEEIGYFSKEADNQSMPNTLFPLNKNVFLTSLFVSASLVPAPGTAQQIVLENSCANEITKTFNYNKELNIHLVNYIDHINVISKKKITKQALLRDILSYKSLLTSWDGYGAIPLEIESAANSIWLLDLIGESIFCTVNEFYPNPNGTITFEWENSENEMLSLEVGNKSFSYFVEMSSMNVKFFNNNPINAAEAKKLSQFIQAI